MEKIKSIINWIFPSRCVVCNKETISGSLFCENCFGNVVFIDYPHCKCCGKLLDSSYNDEMLCEICSTHERFFDIGRSLFLYNEASSKIIMKIKKEADENVAMQCARMLTQKYHNIITQTDVIIPVPSHILRVIRRGFNPANIIAKHISQLSHVPLQTILKRVKRTDYQKGKSFAERQDNVQNAFATRQNMHNKNVLLVDDVMTTGATISSCSKILKENGASKVNFLTIASTMS